LHPEHFNVIVFTLKGKIFKHAIVFIDIIKVLNLSLNLVRSVLNEITGLYKLTFVGGLFSNSIDHVLISIKYTDNRVLTPFRDMLLKLVLDFECLVAKTSFHSSCYYSEKREVNNIVGKVHNLVVSSIIMLDLFSQIF